MPEDIEQGRLPDDAVLRIQKPETSDGISWRDIQDINVRLGKVEHRVKTIEAGETGKNDRSFQIKVVVITAVLTALITFGGPMAVERFWPEQAQAETADKP